MLFRKFPYVIPILHLTGHTLSDIGHLDFLEKASKMGDYLIVGVHTDPVSYKYAVSGQTYFHCCELHTSHLHAILWVYVCFILIRVVVR